MIASAGVAKPTPTTPTTRKNNMTMSNLINPKTGQPYKVGDKLATKEEVIAFFEEVAKHSGFTDAVCYAECSIYLTDKRNEHISKVVGIAHALWECEYLPYTIKGFFPQHRPEVTTPNPPLTFDEAMGFEELYLKTPDRVVLASTFHPYLVREGGLGELWSIDDFTLIAACIAHGKVYAHNPDEHPPTEREDG